MSNISFKLHWTFKSELSQKKTCWTSEFREKGSSGPVFGINAMCQAGQGQLDPKTDYGLAMGALERCKEGLVNF